MEAWRYGEKKKGRKTRAPKMQASNRRRRLERERKRESQPSSHNFSQEEKEGPGFTGHMFQYPTGTEQEPELSLSHCQLPSNTRQHQATPRQHQSINLLCASNQHQPCRPTRLRRRDPCSPSPASCIMSPSFLLSLTALGS